MDSKKQFASLMEDHSAGRGPGPGIDGGRLGTRGGDGRSTSPSHSGLDDLDVELTLDHAAPSCVTKETPQEDCARHRFIVWAAVKRNSSVRMTAQERLECPLLRCTKRFSDHESMLKHLASCRYLASGEYWCYDHMRVERFDDIKCKRCLGHPSKRRKILHLAKNFFHTLGHKSKKAPGLEFEDEEVLLPPLPPPPSYDSLITPAADPNASELPSTEILEIDSMEVSLLEPTPMPAPSDVIDPQALLMPMVPELPELSELDSTTLPNERFMSWQPLPGMSPSPFPVMPQGDAFIQPSAARPALQLATAGLQGHRQAPRPAPVVPRSKGLSPSSSVRSTASTETNASMMSNGSSMISPASNWSGAWSRGPGSNTGMNSPVDGVVTDDMFADAMNGFQNDARPDYLHGIIAELPADFPMLENAPVVVPDEFFGFDASPPAGNISYPPQIVLPDEAMEIGELGNEQTDSCCSDAKSLVSSVWDALQQHISASMQKLQGCKANHIASQLSSMTTTTIASTGLRALRDLINGREPSYASDALCMIHLVTALALVLHEQETSGRVKGLFLQSLAYADGLPPNERTSYQQLIVSIWQPPDVSQADFKNHPAFKAVFKGKGKAPEVATPGSGQRTDSLLNETRNFLDELEISLIRQSTLSLDLQLSDLYLAHCDDMGPVGTVNRALVATAKHAIEMISQMFCGAGVGNRLQEIYQRLGKGSISTVRRLEIEILQAGRDCLPRGQFFDQFIPKSRVLFDRMYEQHDVGPSQRDAYHGLGIALIEKLFPEFDNAYAKPAVEPLNDMDMFFNDMSFEVGDAVMACTEGLQMASSELFDFDLTQAQLSTPPATTSGTPSSSTQAANVPTAPEVPEKKAAPDSEGDYTICRHCGYKPSGHPQWFKGSMNKHMRLQHNGGPPTIYACPFPGCKSKYKNRADNLRQHQQEKNHWVEGDVITPRRPSKKRKKTAKN